KMVRRHPHVFGGETAASSGEVLRNWEALKLAERKASGKAAPAESMLDSVPRSLPAVMEAFQASTKAARVGFEWPDAAGVLAKLEEETRELRDEAERTAPDPRRVAEEVGDLLFTAVNVARLLGVDPESALKAANRKFRRRFGHVEARLREGGRGPADSTLDEMEALWQEAKAAERQAGPR
ncbi:MAG TPA: MazG family protein, partial [Gemmatimonadota bacterium]|nr:MazG family protein [Gemmatimonadota bacterium]